MFLIPCPFCGERPHTDFVYGGDANVPRPSLDLQDPAIDAAAVYQRPNPCGPHREYWHHRNGCRQWLCVERDTATHAITSAISASQLAHGFGQAPESSEA